MVSIDPDGNPLPRRSSAPTSMPSSRFMEMIFFATLTPRACLDRFGTDALAPDTARPAGCASQRFGAESGFRRGYLYGQVGNIRAEVVRARGQSVPAAYSRHPLPRVVGIG